MAGIYILSNKNYKYIGQDSHDINVIQEDKLNATTNRVFAHYWNALNKNHDNANKVFTEASESAELQLHYTENLSNKIDDQEVKLLQQKWTLKSPNTANMTLDIAEIAYIAQALVKQNFRLLNYQGGGQGNYLYNPQGLITKIGLKHPQMAAQIQRNLNAKPYIYYNFEPNVYNAWNFFSPEKVVLGLHTSIEVGEALNNEIYQLYMNSTKNAIQNNASLILYRYLTGIQIKDSRKKDQTESIKKIFTDGLQKTLKQWNQLYEEYNIHFVPEDFHFSQAVLDDTNKEIKRFLAGTQTTLNIPIRRSVTWIMKANSDNLPKWVRSLSEPENDGTDLLKKCAIRAFTKIYKKYKGSLNLCSTMKEVYTTLPRIISRWYDFYDEEMAVLQKLKENYGGLAFNETMFNDQKTNVPMAVFYRKESKDKKPLFHTGPGIGLATHIVEIDRRIKRKSDITIY